MDSTRHPTVRPAFLAQISTLAVFAVTAFAVVWWWPVAWAPAILAAIVYAMYVVMVVIDRRAHAGPADPVAAGDPAARELSSERGIAWKTVVTILVGIAAIATVLAASLLDARTVAIGAMAIFGLAVFMGMPFLALTITEEIGAVRDEADGDRRERGPSR
jgi:hypothetical protein